jgi:hypothetical protein
MMFSTMSNRRANSSSGGSTFRVALTWVKSMNQFTVLVQSRTVASRESPGLASSAVAIRSGTGEARMIEAAFL